ncbi:uncharacterized protein [Centruroides vittatus]|uniref:uncharacterized protein n=1 Tax=Centruroides vittatus TaxID=120091 RepID=UPI00350EE97B
MFFVNYRGEVSFNEGKLHGLRNLHRAGDCTITVTEEKLSLDVNLSVNELNVEYSGRMSFMGLMSTFELSGKIGIISADLTLEAREGKQEPELEVTKFNIYELNGVEIQLKNHRALNPIFKFITKISMRFFRSKIESIIEKHLRKLVNDEIKNINIGEVLAQTYV